MHSRPFILALLYLVTGCAPSEQAKLTGTWSLDRVRSDGVAIHTAITIASDGKYSARTTSTVTNSSAAATVTLEGTFEIKDGYLMDTVTRHDVPTFQVPTTFRARIIRFDEQELLAFDEGNSVEVLFRKEQK